MNTSTTTTTTTTSMNTAVTRRFSPYAADLPISLVAGERAVKLLYRAAVSGANKGKKAAEDSYIVIPDHITPETILEKFELLAPVLVHSLQQAEEALLRKEHIAKAKGFTDSWFSLDKIAAYLEEAGASKRLTKEDISAWVESIAPAFSSVIADKLGLPSDWQDHDESLEKVTKTLAVYAAKFGSLAAPSTILSDADQKGLSRVFEVVDTALDTSTGKSIKARIDRMKADTDALLDL